MDVHHCSITISKKMKKLLVISLMLLLCGVVAAQGKLQVTFNFLNIVEGYDHTTKCQVFIDDEMVGESPEVPESKGSTFSVEVPAGSHNLRIVNFALYEGNWEEHTIANNYSIDCLFEEEHNFKKNEKLFLVFDIDSGTISSWKKAPKVKKPKKAKG